MRATAAHANTSWVIGVVPTRILQGQKSTYVIAWPDKVQEPLQGFSLEK